MSDHEHGEHTHEHAPGVEHDHDHGTDSQRQTITPQPVPMTTNTALLVMEDGTDRVTTTFNSVNGQWVAFFDRDGAVEYAKTLLGLAYAPKQDADAPAGEIAPETVVVEVPDLEGVTTPN